KEFWNQRYDQHSTVYGFEPNAYFKSKLDLHIPSSLLLPAEGEGRNALYAAGVGWEVDAFDFSLVAQKKALSLADEKRLSIHYFIEDITHFIPIKQYGAIGLLYVHLHESIRKAFHQKIINALLPSGVLILEAFSKGQLHNTSGGPKSIDQLYSIDELTADFSELHILEAVETTVDLNEGPFHKGRANVVRVYARKN
ncbi:MAG: class I SAM-dependent methyltransferase, partial [Sediminibacterium sp.]|nr:class I SAM-dependent methyltransferase [Sediminibacterium sp.]